jgi:hypothetical protein
MFTAFVSGFFAVLGGVAALAAIGLVLTIPISLYLRKNLKIWKEMYGVIKRANERADGLQVPGVAE